MKKSLILASLLAICAICPGRAIADDDPEVEQLKDRLYTQIIQAYNVKDWAEVNSLMERIIAAGEDLDDLEITYAQALSGVDRNAEAIDRLNKYLAANPTDFQAFQVLGDIKAADGDSTGAIAAYEQCASLRPDFARPQVSMGRMLAQTDPEGAVEHFNKAIDIFLRAKRPDAAIQIGMEAMQCAPENTRLLLLMGETLRQANMDDNALSFYAEVIAVNNRKAVPNLEEVADADYSISMIYYLKHEYAKALNFIQAMYSQEQILSEDPASYAEALCLGAACAKKLGNDALAEQYLEKAKTFSPEDAQPCYESLLTL